MRILKQIPQHQLNESSRGYYFDFINLDFTYDKRNQRFQTSDGFLSSFSTDIPLVSESNTFTNAYNYSLYKELFDNNVSNFFYFKTANSISGDDIKLSERLYVPGSKLRVLKLEKLVLKMEMIILVVILFLRLIFLLHYLLYWKMFNKWIC